MNYTSVDLENEEKKILKRVERLKRLQKVMRRVKKSLGSTAEYLKKDIKSYQELREKLQRNIWKGDEGKAWCQKCGSYKQEKTQLLYTEGLEEGDKFVRRIRSFCQECIVDVFGQPQGGDDKFQCYHAEKHELGFIVYKLGRWTLIRDLKKIAVEIEMKNIPNKDFKIGKNLEFFTHPDFIFKINGLDVLKKEEKK